MALQTSIGAGTFSALTYANVVVPTTLPSSAASWQALFATIGDFTEIKDIREMPTFGTPANIVKVPQFGVAQSLSIGAQSDAPDLELTLNYIPSRFAIGQQIKTDLDSKASRIFRFSLLYAKPTNLADATTGIGTVQNSSIYFVGKMESLQIMPSLSDSNTATLALSIQSDFFGPYTVDA
jgi:hypothetical protein